MDSHCSINIKHRIGLSFIQLIEQKGQRSQFDDLIKLSVERKCGKSTWPENNPLRNLTQEYMWVNESMFRYTQLKNSCTKEDL